jgi:hypothetical protein
VTRPQPWLLLAQIAFLIALALGLWLALRPVGNGPGLIWDKAQHFIAFYVLAGMGAASLPRRPLWVPALFLAVYGAAIEGLQALPAIGRDAEWADWAADLIAIGACYGPLLLRPWRRWTSQP